MVNVMFLRYGDCSDDTAAECSAGKEQISVSGWWASYIAAG